MPAGLLRRVEAEYVCIGGAWFWWTDDTLVGQIPESCSAPPTPVVGRMDSLLASFRHLLAYFSLASAGASSISKQPLTELMQQDELQISKLFRTHQCEKVYLDVGTNIGVQIRKVRPAQ
jgi:hypothetical protein